MRIHRIGQKRTVFVRRFIVEVRLYSGFLWVLVKFLVGICEDLDQKCDLV
jgi:hypothetical protein